MSEIKLSVKEITHAVEHWFNTQLFQSQVEVTNVTFLQGENCFAIQFKVKESE